MEELAVKAIIALVRTGIDCCRSTKMYKDEAERIGIRLTLLLAQAPVWSEQLQANSERSKSMQRQLNKAIQRVILCVRAASCNKEDRKSWSRKIKAFLTFKDLCTELQNAEKNLNAVLQDLQLDQTTVIMQQMQTILECFERTKTFSQPAQIMQSSIDNVLATCYKEDTVLTPTDQDSPDDSALISIWSERNDDLRSWSDDAPLYIDRNQLVFRESPAACIGVGGFAKVYRGIYGDDEVAIKVFDRNLDYNHLDDVSNADLKKELDSVLRELRVMKEFGIHPNIVEVIGCHVSNDQYTKPIIVMELMSANLSKLLHKKLDKPISVLSFKHCLDFMIGVARAIEFLHLQGIVHQDVKPLNILVDLNTMVAKLTDFGEAEIKGTKTTRYQIAFSSLKRTTGKHAAGTLIYQAPEILREDITETSRVAEMYSFGVTLWECATREMPHAGKRDVAIVSLACRNNKAMLPRPSDVYKEPLVWTLEENKAFSILEKTSCLCISRDRSKRPTASQAIDLLEGLIDAKEVELLQATLPKDPAASLTKASQLLNNDEINLPVMEEENDDLFSDHEVNAAPYLTNGAGTLTQVSAKLAADGCQSSDQPPEESFIKSDLVPSKAGEEVFFRTSTDAIKMADNLSHHKEITESSDDMSIVEQKDIHSDEIKRIKVHEEYIKHSQGNITLDYMSTKPSKASAVDDADFSNGPAPSKPDIGNHLTLTNEQNENFIKNICRSHRRVVAVVCAAVLLVAIVLVVFILLRSNNSNNLFPPSKNGFACFQSNEELRSTVIAYQLNDGNGAEWEKYGSQIGDWCVDYLNDFSYTFSFMAEFNSDISNWNTSSATNMSAMFYYANRFNQPIGDWDVASVTDMFGMFAGAHDFNQNISSWQVSSVDYMNYMFSGANSFNQNLCAWGDHLSPSTETFNMFNTSSCPIMDDPNMSTKSPFCHECS